MLAEIRQRARWHDSRPVRPFEAALGPTRTRGEPDFVLLRVDVAEEVLDDLRDRLARTRWPDQLLGTGWSYGTELTYLRELCAPIEPEQTAAGALLLVLACQRGPRRQDGTRGRTSRSNLSSIRNAPSNVVRTTS